jgi:tRNA modification GTPase
VTEQATIFALSSAPGRAGVAVVRVSGPRAGTVLDLMAPPRPSPRYAAARHIVQPETGERLDHGLVLWFPAPKSFTGEDTAELHLHGGRAVVKAVLGALGSIPGCRLAEAGEFARRAFDNGRLDLAEAEGLADLIDAETEAQRHQALRQAEGGLSALTEDWRGRLVAASALVEAAIDFSDEADVSAGAFAEARRIAAELETAIARHLDDGHRGEILREGFDVVLAGAPNVGKSSLLNALARREAAIVSAEEGPTRDVIVVKLDLEGLPVVVSDTAGLRAATGEVEREGIRRTLARARRADLVLWLADARAPQPIPVELEDVAERALVVLNKVDLLEGKAPEVPDQPLLISARTGEGIDGLARRLAAIARERIGDREEPLVTQARHRQQLELCHAALRAFREGEAQAIELRAEDLRQAATALGRITGRVDVEDVLDQVFGRFCIGK